MRKGISPILHKLFPLIVRLLQIYGKYTISEVNARFDANYLVCEGKTAALNRVRNRPYNQKL